MNSPVIDLMIRIKNGYMAERELVEALHSNFNVHIVDILKNEGYIKGYEIVEDGNKKHLVIALLYQGKNPAMRDVKIISKPGRKIYVKLRDVKSVLGGLGISILSTPQGVMTNKQARKKMTGGEVLFNVW